MLQVKRIVNEIFTSNTYIVYDVEYDYCWLVDIGDFKRIADVIPPKIKIKGVFLTHTHFDHIYGINQLYDVFPDIAVYVSYEGNEALFSAKKNLSKYHDSPLEYKGSNVMLISDGNTIKLFPGVLLKAVATPGHTSDSMSFLIEDKYLFTGDAFIPGVKVVTKLPNGNRSQAQHSREVLQALSERRIVCPGHGEMFYY